MSDNLIKVELGQTWQWQGHDCSYDIPGTGNISLNSGSTHTVDDSNIDILSLIAEVSPEYLINKDSESQLNQSSQSTPDNVALPPEVHNNRPIASFDEIMKITNDLCAGGGTEKNTLKGLYS